MVKIEMAKYVRLKKLLPFEGANSIETALQTCKLQTGYSFNYKTVNWFCMNLPPQMAKSFQICKWIYFNILTFAIIEEMASGQ